VRRASEAKRGRPAQLVLVVVALLAPAVAHADPEAPAADDAPAAPVTAPAAEAHAAAPAPEKPRRFYLRAGVAEVAPLSSSDELVLADVDGPASLAVQNGPIPGSGSTISSATIPAIIVGYRLHVLHDRLSLETVLGLPFTVKFKATGTLANQSIAPTALGIPTGVQALGPDIGEAQAAPPVLTAVYSLLDHGALRPYAGAGLGVLVAYNAKVTNPMLTAISQPELDIAPAPGLVLQAGLDARIWKRIYARIDVKFIALMRATAEVHHIRMAAPDLPLFGSVEVGTAKLSMWVNPLIVQAGIGTDF
jgi:outer membrane protein W